MKNKKKYFSFLGLSFIILILISITGKSLADNKQRQMLKSGNVISLRSTNYPDRYIRHRNYLGQLTKVITELDTNDSLFIIRPGFAGGNSISFESVNYPGHFLRHEGFVIKLSKRQDNNLYRQDASFYIRSGMNGQGLSFESVNYPKHFIRHCSFNIYIDNNNQGNSDCNPDINVYLGDISYFVEPSNY